jgi:hypothetical protein
MNKQMEMDNKVMRIQVLSELQLDEENYHQLLDKINSISTTTKKNIIL